MQRFDVAGYHIRGLVKGLDALGLDAGALLRSAKLDRRALEDPEARFGEDQMLALWLLAERQHAGPSFGLALAMHVPFGALELIDYLVAASPSVGSGMQCLERHARLCASGFFFRIGPATTGAEPATQVRLEHRHGMDLVPPSLIEYLWALVIHRFRAVCGEGFCPTLRLRQPPAGSAHAYRAALGRVPERGSEDALLLSEQHWEMANPRSDSMLSGLLHAHASDVTQRLPEGGFRAAAVSAIAECLRHGDPAMLRVAARLGLTTRTLQRRVDESLGTTFHDLVEQTRRDLALRYLSDSLLSLAEISGLLAYSEPSAFGRAFQRWTGTTPAAFRRTVVSAPSGRAHVDAEEPEPAPRAQSFEAATD